MEKLWYIKDKACHFIVSLKVSLLFIFSLLFCLTFIIFLSIFYYHITSVVKHAALLLMEKNNEIAFNKLSADIKTLNLNKSPQQEFSRILARHHLTQQTNLAIMQAPNHIIATATEHEKMPAWIMQAFSKYLKTKHSFFILTHHQLDYLFVAYPITTNNKNKWFVINVEPASNYIAAIHHIEFSYVAIFFLIFIFGLFLISTLVSHVINPIKQLVTETQKIKNFEIGDNIQINSYLKEVIELRNAIDSMKAGLRSFKKFVPADLVRQLIKIGADAQAGGSKRELALFFSDIKDFTLNTEKLPTNQLIQHVNTYFETLSDIIVNNNGTIDKYIGDAIMAFWGAPLPVYNPCQAAALAALACQKKLLDLNKTWQNARQPQFKTRIGLHYGEAVVGNVGSSQRLNYTVLGNNVNIASRLVNTNKIYGTQILVSDVVYTQLYHQFVFRLVDQVALRGVARSLTIYELLANHKTELTFDIDQYNEDFAIAYHEYQQKNWQAAKSYFTKCLQSYPNDSLATLYITRCEYNILRPPGHLWTGVYKIR